MPDHNPNAGSSSVRPIERTRRRSRTAPWALSALLLGLALASCASPRLVPAGAERLAPRLETSTPERPRRIIARMPDGARLPLRVWPADLAPADPIAVVLALHGFNDYGNTFVALAERLAADGVRTYAVDQRGFGEAPLPGHWHGSERLAADVPVLLQLLRQRHPGAPVYVIGVSMGAAVAMTAAARDRLQADGLVLIAPAVWARESMPWYQRAMLEIAVRTLPDTRLEGAGIDIRPSDNRAMLRAMGKDPLVIKDARIHALWGITNLMDLASTAAPRLDENRLGMPVLILYGAHDEVIPPSAFCRFVARLPRGAGAPQLVLYRHGWHMLTRDLQGARVRHDIATWLLHPGAPLPSGEEAALDGERMQGFCASAGA